MNVHASSWKKRLRGAVSGLASALLTLTLVPAVPARAAAPREDWASDIAQMISAGPFEPGEAVVAYLTSGDSLTAQAVPAADELEPLMRVSPRAAGVSATGGLATQAARDVTLALVRSDTLSTEDLLRSLADDPRVAFAEPNYVDELDEGTAPQADTQDSVPAEEPSAADLTPLLWGMSDTSETGVRVFADQGNASINVPNFGAVGEDGNMDEEIVVAVIDGAVDFTNPDLASRAYTFSPELQERLGCDEHGFNASAESADGKLVYLQESPGTAHGTHCAGIIGAAWDGQGVSGVGSNVRIVSIQNAGSRTEEENGRTSLANGLRAYDFVKRANEAGADIRLTSNSWSVYQASRALDAAVRELGETQGVVSVFAAGNESSNSDISGTEDATLGHNPYAVIVAASDQAGALAPFSCFGQNTVTLAAPGTDILSTAPTNRPSYLPVATPESNLLFEDFETDGPIVTVRQLSKEGAVVGEPASITGEQHLTGTHALKLPLVALPEEDSVYNHYYLRFDFDLSAASERAGIDVASALKSAPELYFGTGLVLDPQMGMATINSLTSNLMKGQEVESTQSDQVRMAGSTSCPLITSAAERNADELDGHLVVDVTLTAGTLEAPYLCLDTVGVGTRAVPYKLLSGTSMACPMISGSLAVLAAQSNARGAQLASLARAHVRIPGAGMLPVRTGGTLDFTVGAEAAAPYITAVELAGDEVRVTGEGFGAQPGEALLGHMVTGAETESVAATVRAWSDTEVTLLPTAPCSGVLSVGIANAQGKFDTFAAYVGKGEMTFEHDLPFDVSVGAPFAMDAMGDLETKGPLVGMGGKLYYLPSFQPTELAPSYQSLYCFDIASETWAKLPSVPEPLQNVSSVMFDGKLVVEGATMQLLPSNEPTNEFVGEGAEAEERVYVFDPAQAAWTQASHEGMNTSQSIFNDNGQLLVVGGMRPLGETMPDPSDLSAWYEPIRHYEPDHGAGDEVCPMSASFANAQVVARDGIYYLYDPTSYNFGRIKDGVLQVFQSSPAFADVKEPQMEFENDPPATRAVLCVCTEGVLVVGPPTSDGSSDVYLLRDGSNKFEPQARRASDARVQSPAACSYQGRLYVIGSSWLEPDMRFFRATDVEVPDYPGDLPADAPVGAGELGWIYAGGAWYVSVRDADGALSHKTGWHYDRGWYYLDPARDGQMATGWHEVDGKTYWLNTRSNGHLGRMATGWLLEDGTWYLMDSSGALRRGWAWDEGTQGWYYLGQDGRMLRDCMTPDGERVDASGRWVA